MSEAIERASDETRRPVEPLVPAGLNATIVFVRHGESVLITEGRFQGQLDSPLSPLGERQAAAVARRLAGPRDHPVLPVPTGLPVEIVHSPLSRTRQTAEGIAVAFGRSGSSVAGKAEGYPPARAAVKVEGDAPGRTSSPGSIALRPEPGLVEIGQGEWEGLHRAEIEERYADLLAAWRQAPTLHVAPGGETLRDVRARVRPALERVLRALDAAEPPTDTGHKGAGGYPAVASADTPWSVLVGHDGVFKVTLITLFGLPLEQFWSFPFAMCGLTIVEIRDGRPVLRAHNLTEHLSPLLERQSVAETEERQRSGAL